MPNREAFDPDITEISKHVLASWSFSVRLPRKMSATARQAIEALDPTLKPDIYVIGLPHETRGFPLVCGSAATRGIAVETAIIRRRARALERDYWRHPLKHPLYKRGREDSVAVRSECLRRTVQRLIDRTADDSDDVQFCGEAAELQGFDILPAIGVDRTAYDAHATLKRVPKLYGPMRQSLLRALIEVLLEAITAEIAGASMVPFPPSPAKSQPLRFPPTLSEEPDDYLRAAGRWFMAMLLARSNGRPMTGLFEHCDAISTRPYEGRPAKGRLLLTHLNNRRVQYSVRFQKPVALADHKWVRKLVEMSSDDMFLVSDTEHVYGLGTIPHYDPKRENAFLVEFRGHHRWSLFHAQDELLRVVDGTPQPLRRLPDAAQFKVWLVDAMPSCRANIDGIWELVSTAAKQRHGTMLIIHEDAEREAQRLARQSTLIEPDLLSPSVLERISGIDGGVLIDTFGHCHAIGVILDGVATQRGAPSRGSRYNSALRYVDSCAGARRMSGQKQRRCIVVVVSADGDVDLVYDEMDSERRSIQGLDEAHYEDTADGA